MSELRLVVLSLRYSSWSMRPWLALAVAGAEFETETVEVSDLAAQSADNGPSLVDLAKEQLTRRRAQGSVTGLFPVLYVDGSPIHESLAICEWAAETFPEAGLWPADRLERARARSICSEMSTGFSHLRTNMSCHVYARVPDFRPDPSTTVDIERVLEIWRTSLERSGGPFLFGSFGIADCFYFPVLTRFRTYGIELDAELERYAEQLEASPAVGAWWEMAASAPALPVYDHQIHARGGDPLAARPSD